MVYQKGVIQEFKDKPCLNCGNNMQVKSGRQKYCTDCRSIMIKQHKQTPEFRARDKIYKQKHYANPINRQKKRDHDREYQQIPEIKERIKLYKKAWGSDPANIPKIRESQKRFRDRPENKEKASKYQRGRREELLSNAHKVIAKAHNYPIQCMHCDSTKNIYIDHINEDGEEEREMMNQNLYKIYRKIPELSESEIRNNYQLLCCACNLRKAREHKECLKAVCR